MDFTCFGFSGWRRDIRMDITCFHSRVGEGAKSATETVDSVPSGNFTIASWDFLLLVQLRQLELDSSFERNTATILALVANTI